MENKLRRLAGSSSLPETEYAFNDLPKNELAHDLAMLKLQSYIQDSPNCSMLELYQQYTTLFVDALSTINKFPN